MADPAGTPGERLRQAAADLARTKGYADDAEAGGWYGRAVADAMAIYSAVPAPVLEALASAWEDGAQAAETAACTNAGLDLSRWHAGQGFALSRCARQLREAITRASAG